MEKLKAIITELRYGKINNKKTSKIAKKILGRYGKKNYSMIIEISDNYIEFENKEGCQDVDINFGKMSVNDINYILFRLNDCK